MLNLTRHCYSPVRYTKFSVEYVGVTLSLGEESVQVAHGEKRVRTPRARVA